MTTALRRIARVGEAVRGQGGFTLAEMLMVIVILAMIMGAVLATLDVSQRAFSRASASEDVQAGMRAAMDLIVSDLRLIGSFYTGAGNSGSPITAFSSSSITFWGDINADTAGVTFSGGAATVTEATLAAAVSSGATMVNVTPAASGTDGSTGFANGEMLYVANGSVREVRTVTSTSGNSVGISSGLMTGYEANSLIRSVEQVTYTHTAGSPLGTLTRTTAAEGTQTLLDNVVSFSLTGYDYAGNTTVNVAALEEIQVDVTTRASAGASGASQRRMTIRVRVRVVP